MSRRRHARQAREVDHVHGPIPRAGLLEQLLARWVGETLVPRYELTRNELPDCWALHPPVVAELSWRAMLETCG